MIGLMRIVKAPITHNTDALGIPKDASSEVRFKYFGAKTRDRVVVRLFYGDTRD